MAENQEPFGRRRADRAIRIERRGRGIVPWVIGALALLGVALVLWPAHTGPEIVGFAPPGGTDSAAGTVASDSEMRRGDLDAAVGDYVSFVTGQRARAAVGPSHEYTAEGLRRLATAIAALAVRDSVAGRALEPRIQALRARADALQADPSSAAHAPKAREAFLVAASVLESIQDRRFRGLDDETAAVRRAAEDVEAREPLTEQAAAVARYFGQTADLLRAMAGASG